MQSALAFLKRHYLFIEFTVFFLLIPISFMLLPKRSVVFLCLWMVAIIGYFWMRYHDKEKLSHIMRFSKDYLPEIKRMAPLFLLNISLLALLTYYLKPDLWLKFPSERPLVWAMVMLLYPILSAAPQEFVYRVIFFQRYRPLFASDRAMIFASSTTFGIAHAFLLNFIAPGLSIIGGVIFCLTYLKRKSFWLVLLEHALYGNMIFTLGLGYYFYHAAH
ncbi:MAG: CPBP family intramembrane glutamic endopeptidase [Rickettsiales bacterium]